MRARLCVFVVHLCNTWMLVYVNAGQDDDDNDSVEGVVKMNAGGRDLTLDDAASAPPQLVNCNVQYEVPENGKGSSSKIRGHNEDEEVQSAVEIDLLQVQNIKIEKKNKRKRKGEDKPVLMWEIWEQELDRWVDKNMTVDTDLNSHNEVVPETSEAPPDLIMPLLRYQKEWLAWALKQEESTTRGGILADEMGMGKTVQAIALVLAKRAFCQAVGGLNIFLPTSSSKGLPGIKATLVICPLVAVIQWVGEIDRFTGKGTNKVLVYHGANRGKSHHQFSEYDFIITTYSIVEAEYRKNVMRPKERCEWCGKLLNEQKMKIHLKYFCGPDAQKTDKQSKQQSKGHKLGLKLSKQKTASDEGITSSGFEEDIKKRGRKKNKKPPSKQEESGAGCLHEVSAGAGCDLCTQKSILHSVKWDRIILDEVKLESFYCFSLHFKIVTIYVVNVFSGMNGFQFVTEGRVLIIEL